MLLKVFNVIYYNFDIIVNAEKKLTLLTQKDNFSNFTDFITKFISLANYTKINNTTYIRFIYDKVNSYIYKALIFQILQPNKNNQPNQFKIIS